MADDNITLPENPDFGNDFTPSEDAAPKIELTQEELEKVGLAPKEAEDDKKEPDKAEDDKKEPDKAEDDKKADDKPRDEKGKFIPKARFDELNAKAKAKVAALESKIKAMEDRLAPADGKVPDVAALEKVLDEKGDEYGKLLADGELEKANAVLRDINKINRQLGAIEAAALANAHAQESTHVDALGQLVDMYKEAYPVFDDANKELYNQDLVNYVADLQTRFELTGSSPADALREAVEITVAKFGLVSADEAPPVEPKKPDKGAERKASGVAKALDTAKKQPASLEKVGMDSDKSGISKIDVNSLTYEQFNALPESTLARLRGDYT